MSEYDQSLIRYGAFCIWILAHLYFYLWVKFNQIDRQAKLNAYLDESAQYYDEDVTHEEMIRDGVIKPDNPRIIAGHRADTLITRNPELRWPLDEHGNVGNQPKRRKYRDNPTRGK